MGLRMIVTSLIITLVILTLCVRPEASNQFASASTNSGNWTQTGNVTGDIIRLSASANGQYVLAAVEEGEIYESENFGKSFNKSVLPSPFEATDTACGESGQNMSLAGKTESSAYVVSNDYGVTWTLRYENGVQDSYFRALAMSKSSQFVYLGGVSTSLYKSTDYGFTFDTIVRNEFYYATQIVCSSNGQYVLVLADAQGFTLSNDYGATWTNNYDFYPIYFAMSGTGQYIYAALIDQIAFAYSYDYGVTWNTTVGNLAELRDFSSIATDSTGQFVVFASDHAIFQSATYGQSSYLSFGCVNCSFGPTVSAESGMLLYAASGSQLYSSSVNLTQSEEMPTIVATPFPTPFHTPVPSTMAPTSALATTELEFLQAFYNSTGGPYWYYTEADDDDYTAYFDSGSPWDFRENNPSPCTENWVGVYCQLIEGEYHLIELTLEHYNLTGTLPNCWDRVPYLEALKLTGNSIYGRIPDTMYGLTSLETLSLPHNQLSGSISVDLFRIVNVQYITLSFNRMNGTLPENLTGPYYFQLIELQGNSLSGTFPAVLGAFNNYLWNLSYNQLVGQLPTLTANYAKYDFSYNKLTGSVPSGAYSEMYLSHNQLTSWTNKTVLELPYEVYLLDFSYNSIEGSIPATVKEMNNLAQLDLSDNLFSGSLPSLESNIALYYLNLSNNQLTGSLPTLSTYNLETSIVVDASNNYFSGTVPLSLMLNLASYPYLVYLYLSNNDLSALPTVSSVGETSQLYYLDVSNNNLEYCNFSGYASVFIELISLYLDSTTQIGMMPIALSEIQLTTLSITGNYYTGPLPTELNTMTKVALLYLSDNLFSGSIPVLNALKSLVDLYLDNNLLSGSISSSSLSHLISLQTLSLEDNRLSGELNFFNFTAQTQLINVDLSNNAFSGSLPEALFLIPSLSTFAAVSNCIRGTLPTTICSASSLSALVLDGLNTAPSCRNKFFPHFHGMSAYQLETAIQNGVPVCLFALPYLETLHLSGTGLTGTLPNELSGLLYNFALSHNHLTGTLPPWTKANWSNLDLSYNNLRDTLTDHFTSGYTAGNVSLEVNHLSGKVPAQLLHVQNIDVLNGNLFQCDASRNDIPSHDGSYSTYSCGSDSFNDAFYVWISLTFCCGVVSIVLFSRFCPLILRCQDMIIVAETNRALPNIELMSLLYNEIRRFIFWLTCGVVLILLPVYCALTVFYGTYINEYVWITSGIYLTGLVPGIVLILAYTLLGAICVYVWWLSLSTLRARSDAVAMKDTEILKMSEDISKQKRPYVQLMLVMTVLLSDVTLMIALNVWFVLITLHYDQNIVHIAQVAIAIIKLVWNNNVVGWVLRKSTLTSRWFSIISLEVMLIIFNNVMAPFIAVAVVNVDCFYNLFFAASPVTSLYTVEECASFNFVYDDTTGQLVSSTCTSYEVQTRQTSFSPPFVYSYQCSSAFISTYADVYVFMFIMVALRDPLVDVMLVCLCRRFGQPNWMKWWRYHDVSRILFTGHNDSDGPRARLKPTNQKVRGVVMVGQVCSVLALLGSFGVVVPLLMVIGCSAVFASSYYHQICIGLLVSPQESDTNETQERRVQLNEECSDFIRVFQRSLWWTLPYLALFYALILFDTTHSFAFPVVVSCIFVCGLVGSILWSMKKAGVPSMSKDDDARNVELKTIAGGA